MMPGGKTVVLAGGSGLLGCIVAPALAKRYRIIVADIRSPPQDIPVEYLHLDITDYDCVSDRLPENTDVIINLTALPPMPDIVEPDRFQRMSALYIQGAYNLFMAAANRQIKKVIYASSSHAAGFHENKGESALGREMRVSDYPQSNDLYGAMKLCAEQFGHIFSVNYGISVICLRIANVIEHEREVLARNERARKTVLSHADVIEIFRLAIEADLKYGLYYAVSDNPGKPWSTDDLRDTLGFESRMNANHIIDGKGGQDDGV